MDPNELKRKATKKKCTELAHERHNRLFRTEKRNRISLNLTHRSEILSTNPNLQIREIAGQKQTVGSWGSRAVEDECEGKITLAFGFHELRANSKGPDS